MFERWTESHNKEGKFSTLFIYLFKLFYSLPHGLLLAKLKAYAFSYSFLKLILNFLSDRRYRTKIKSTSSNSKDLLLGLIGVSERSYQRSLLFNIYIYIIYISYIYIIYILYIYKYRYIYIYTHMFNFSCLSLTLTLSNYPEYTVLYKNINDIRKNLKHRIFNHLPVT